MFTPIRLMISIGLICGLFGSGCGYSIRPPYDQTVKTVYIPIFKSVTFRRNVNLMLTKAVKDEVERRTPFKVVGREDIADTTLFGEVNFADKNTIIENPFNLPRQLTATMNVTIKWVDNRLTGEEADKKKAEPPALVSEIYYFSPELGETSQLAFQRVCDKLAMQIVGMMEEPW